MSNENNNGLSVSQRRAMKRAEFKRKFGNYWYIYVTLIGTATLSVISGLMLPFSPDKAGNIVVTVGGILAAVYYSIGFLTTGEGASYFWFDKLTDHDPDNGTQQVLAGAMLALAVATSLTTALAAGAFIAYWLGIFDQFYVMPTWAQKWVVWAIPTMWVIHFVAGTIFRAVSDEAEYEREAKARIRGAQNKVSKSKAEAKAEFWEQHAPTLARQLGEAEAQLELDNYQAVLNEKRNARGGSNQQPRQMVANAAATKKVEIQDENFTDGRER